MPSKYVVRSFTENSFYHVFNRGVEKRNIFLDEQDYKTYFYYLLIYLYPLEEVLKLYPKLHIRLQAKNLSSEVSLLAYCLMPNHFHLLLKQNSKDAVSKLLKQITNAYTLYFNQKYKRVGGLFQGTFKAARVDKDEVLLHITRYIHLNPVVAEKVQDPKNYLWSSHKYYIGTDKTFVNREIVLSQFRSKSDYEKFIIDQIEYASKLESIKHMLIED